MVRVRVRVRVRGRVDADYSNNAGGDTEVRL